MKRVPLVFTTAPPIPRAGELTLHVPGRGASSVHVDDLAEVDAVAAARLLAEPFAQTYADPAHVAENTFSLEDMMAAMETLRKGNVPMVDGAYLAAVPPENHAFAERLFGPPEWNENLNTWVFRVTPRPWPVVILHGDDEP